MVHVVEKLPCSVKHLCRPDGHCGRCLPADISLHLDWQHMHAALGAMYGRADAVSPLPVPCVGQ